MDSGATPHMVSKNELTTGEKDTNRRSKEPTVITSASSKAESTEEATDVKDLDVFVHCCCCKIHQQCPLWIYYAKNGASPMNRKERVSIVD